MGYKSHWSSGDQVSDKDLELLENHLQLFKEMTCVVGDPNTKSKTTDCNKKLGYTKGACCYRAVMTNLPKEVDNSKNGKKWYEISEKAGWKLEKGHSAYFCSMPKYIEVMPEFMFHTGVGHGYSRGILGSANLQPLEKKVSAGGKYTYICSEAQSLYLQQIVITAFIGI